MPALATYRVAISFPYDSALPADVFTINPHFNGSDPDALAAAIHARAYSKAPEFYGFYRSLQAYRNSLGKDGDVMVVTPEGEFFKYLDSAGKR